MEIATIPAKDLRHARVAQEWIKEDRQEGEARGDAKVMLRPLKRRCGAINDATIARIQALPLDQLEAPVTAGSDSPGPIEATFRSD